jgi:hypothetical protein
VQLLLKLKLPPLLLPLLLLLQNLLLRSLQTRSNLEASNFFDVNRNQRFNAAKVKTPRFQTWRFCMQGRFPAICHALSLMMFPG